MRIESAANERYRFLRKLSVQSKARKESGKFIIESPQIIREMSPEMWRSAEIYLAESTAERYLQWEEMQDQEYIILDDKLFSNISDTIQSQGIIAVVSQVGGKKQDFKRVLILDEIRDPGNLGTLLRSAEAFGFSTVILTKNSCELYNPKVVRSSMGSILRLNILADFTESEVLEFLGNDCCVYAAVLDSDALSADDLAPASKIALIIGNESRGVSSQWLNHPGVEKIRLPMSGEIESLNAAVAGSILMYLFSAQSD